MTAAEVDALLADVDALGGRDYPEIGVPAFLIGEDLTAPAPALAATLGELAAAIASRRGLDAAAIAQALEVLADRRFLPDAATPFSRTAALHPAP